MGNSKRRRLASIGIGLMLCAFISLANASLLHNFIDGNGTVVGHIEFSSPTPGTILGFELTGPVGVTLTEDNLCPPGIASGAQFCEITDSAFDSSPTTWSIDANGMLNDFFLHLDFDDMFGGDELEGNIAFLNPASLGFSSTQTVQIGGSTGCSPQCQFVKGRWFDFVTGGLRVIPASLQVPEPATAGLLGLGLLLLGLLKPNRSDTNSPVLS